jgi:uncharacterized protein
VVAPTYLLVDGENIDGVLGQILGHRPEPDQRPRWERVRIFAEHFGGGETRALFFINASSGQIPGPFIQAIRIGGYVPVLLSGQGKVVDVAITRTLAAIAKRPGALLLASHDADFAGPLMALMGAGRRIGIIGFREFVSGQLAQLPEVELIDLEDDVGAFLDAAGRLPRDRIIPIEAFDPEAFLGPVEAHSSLR